MSRNAESRFSMLPEAEIERSKVRRNFSLKTTFNAGELVPFFVDPVYPGDTFSLDMSSLIRMSTPIFPTLDNSYLDTYFFFVPSRLLWDHWKEFNGENSSGYWTQQVEYTIPQLVLTDDLVSGTKGFDIGSIGDYMALPVDITGSVDALPFRAYVAIWNEWFRDQNTMPPAYFTKSDSNVNSVRRAAVESAENVFDATLMNALYGARPLPVSKYHDYFTSCLPQPQKGPAVDLPLYQDKIPVLTGDTTYTPTRNLMTFGGVGAFIPSSNQGVYLARSGGTSSLQSYSGIPDNVSGQVPIAPNNLYADVSNVAVATISQLRQAFQLQRLYEKDARGGTRYREIIKMHFGVDSPDARMQIPEYLGGKRIPINIDQVLQTSSTDATSPQGNTAAYSLTTDIDSCFTKSFTEHGYVIGVCCVRTEHTYQQGIERFWSRKNRFDYYWPALAHISEQAVLVKEIYATGGEHDDDAFGYQEAWADLRYKPSRITGQLRSTAPQSLDAWHYGDYYSGGNDNFVLNADWLQETPVNIDRTLAVPSSTAHQFIADFYFKFGCVRPIPLYSIPGLIDHF